MALKDFRLPTVLTKERPTWVGVVIYDSMGQILMVQKNKKPGQWGIPGGKIEDGETDIASRAMTEVAEECGIQLDAAKLQPLSETTSKNRKMLGLKEVTQGIVVFRCKVDNFDGTKPNGREIGAIKAMAQSEIANVNVEAKFLPALAEAKRVIEEEMVREGREGGMGRM